MKEMKLFKFKKKYNKKNYQKISLDKILLKSIDVNFVYCSEQLPDNISPLYISFDFYFQFNENVWVDLLNLFDYNAIDNELTDIFFV
jgi:hypothetical protein